MLDLRTYAGLQPLDLVDDRIARIVLGSQLARLPGRIATSQFFIVASGRLCAPW
jgi:hypothetical protein